MVGQFGGGSIANDLVDVYLKSSLGGEVYSKKEVAEMDAVRGCFVACEEKNEGVAYDFRFREYSVGFGMEIVLEI